MKLGTYVLPYWQVTVPVHVPVLGFWGEGYWSVVVSVLGY